MAFAYVALAVTLALAYVIGTYVLRLPRPAVGALMCVAVFGNTGYLGLPFNAALFGFDHLGTAVVYDVLVSSSLLVTVGLLDRGGVRHRWPQRPRDRVKGVLHPQPAAVGDGRRPARARRRWRPTWAVDASRILVFAILPIGFFAVGVTLAREAEEGAAKFPPPLNAPVVTGRRAEAARRCPACCSAWPR